MLWRRPCFHQEYRERQMLYWVYPCWKCVGSDWSRGLFVYRLSLGFRFFQRTRIFQWLAERLYIWRESCWESWSLYSFIGKEKTISVVAMFYVEDVMLFCTIVWKAAILHESLRTLSPGAFSHIQYYRNTGGAAFRWCKPCSRRTSSLSGFLPHQPSVGTRNLWNLTYRTYHLLLLLRM